LLWQQIQNADEPVLLFYFVYNKVNYSKIYVPYRSAWHHRKASIFMFAYAYFQSSNTSQEDK